MEVDERDQLPKAGAGDPRPSQGPRKCYRTRVVRSTRPSAAALEALKQERQGRALRLGLYSALHQDRAQEWAEAELGQPQKRHRPEATEVAITINQ